MYDRVVNQLLSTESRQFAARKLRLNESTLQRSFENGQDLLERPASVAKSANPIMTDFLCDEVWYLKVESFVVIEVLVGNRCQLNFFVNLGCGSQRRFGWLEHRSELSCFEFFCLIAPGFPAAPRTFDSQSVDVGGFALLYDKAFSTMSSLAFFFRIHTFHGF